MRKKEDVIKTKNLPVQSLTKGVCRVPPARNCATFPSVICRKERDKAIEIISSLRSDRELVLANMFKH
jgi:hypothetical protein